jgi:phage-related protein
VVVVVGEVGEEEAPTSRCSKLLQACKLRMMMDAWAVGATKKQTHCSRMVEEVAVVEAVVEERTVRPTVVVSGWATVHGHSLRYRRSMEMSVAVVM